MTPASAAAPSSSLCLRMGEAGYQRRIQREAERDAYECRKSPICYPLRKRLKANRWLGWGLKLVGLEPAMRREYLNPQLSHQRWALPRWPQALAGYRILHLSDLHLELDPSQLVAVAAALKGLAVDLVVLTGDLQNEPDLPASAVVRHWGPMRTALAQLQPPDGAFAVLGNHDQSDLVEVIEKEGLSYLLNEYKFIKKADGCLILGGVDDAAFFDNADFARALPPDDGVTPRLLLHHAPMRLTEAAAQGVDLCLCGHTHGGQLCLPGGRHLVCPDGIQPPFVRGRWQVGTMQGYTSRGIGGSHLPLRWNCPPEIALHELHPVA